MQWRQTRTLRGRAGVTVPSRDYIPRLFANGDYVFGSRTFSILQIKFGGKTFTRDFFQREKTLVKRVAWLQSNYGLSKRASEVFLRRPTTQIKRIEELIHGIIDSLLLFDTALFDEDNGSVKIIRHLVKMILTMGPYNIGLLVSYWKELCNFLYNRLAGFQPVLPEPSRENFFRTLLTWPKIQRILNHEVDKRLLESFAHLTSTRQLPAADKRTERKALETFFRSVQEPYPLDIGVLNDVYLLSKHVGEKCIALSKNGCITKPHISMSTAGSYYSTVLEGGRGNEIRESLISRLTVVPTGDETVETPFGQMFCPAGRERWRFWCRNTPYTFYESTRFGDAIQEEEFNKLHLYYQGFDEAIGCQIMVCAYLDYIDWKRTRLPIPCRVLTVPEPGFKARIVTTGPYWLNVLQQGLSHVLKDVLKGHPSSRSSLLKTDQAWQSLYLMCKQGYPEDFLVLSSDLKEATDHIPKVIAVQMLSGFVDGCGLRSNLVETAIDLIKMNRSFYDVGLVSERQTRGVMMGEPLTKCLLTILNLIVEEYAYRMFHKVNLKVSFYESKPWRSYHVGGDDHLAIGPKQYLDYITEFHRKCGSHLSDGKHGASRIAVKYCEKMIYVRNIYHPWTIRGINDSIEGYEISPFVDSIKVRLLSPTTKSFDVVSDRNTAIGKGMSLGRTLKWLNKDHFPTKWVKMVRDRFFSRMGSLLPDRTSGVFWQLMLPSFWGGLDLYTEDDIPRMAVKLPVLTKSIMKNYMKDPQSGYPHVQLLGKFLSNYSYRGFRLNETEVEAMKSHIENIVKKGLPASSWKELISEYDPNGEMPATELADTVYKQGWLTEEEILDQLLRPLLFKEILQGEAKPEPYNTIRLKTRYARLWDLAYTGEVDLTEDELTSVLKTRPQGMFYKVAYPQDMHFVSDRGYIYKSVLDDALHGMPILNIGFPFT